MTVGATPKAAPLMPTPRPSVARFAEEMELRLKANDHKMGWQDFPRHLLIAHLFGEIVEVLDSLVPEEKAAKSVYAARQFAVAAAAELRGWGNISLRPRDIEAYRRELADAANYLHMLHDQEHAPALVADHGCGLAGCTDTRSVCPECRKHLNLDLVTGPRPRWPQHSDKLLGDDPERKRCGASHRFVAEVPPYGT